MNICNYYEIYQAVKKRTDAPCLICMKNPNQMCPVGRNIKGALDIPLNNAQAAMEISLKAYSLKDITSYIIERER